MKYFPHLRAFKRPQIVLLSMFFGMATGAQVVIATCAAQIPSEKPSGPNTVPTEPAQTEPSGSRVLLPKSPAPAPVMINGRPYVRPTQSQQFHDYLRDSYGLPALARTTVRSVIAQGRGKPDAWGQDWPGFGQRFGSSSAVTAINGNVRYGLEELFKEDMRYIPCHGCSLHRKLENALLAEITARHDSDGHRFFTLTPTIADMTGPILANSYWVPGHTTIDGFIGSRLVFATRIGGHLFSEFVLERRHHDAKLPD